MSPQPNMACITARAYIGLLNATDLSMVSVNVWYCLKNAYFSVTFSVRLNQLNYLLVEPASACRYKRMPLCFFMSPSHTLSRGSTSHTQHLCRAASSHLRTRRKQDLYYACGRLLRTYVLLLYHFDLSFFLVACCRLAFLVWKSSHQQRGPDLLSKM